MPTFGTAIHGVSMSVALREAASYASVSRVLLTTYEFTHSSFVGRALIVVSHDDLYAADENAVYVTYAAIAGLKSQGFDESDQASTPLIKLEISGLSTVLIAQLDLALEGIEPVGIVERVYVSDDLTGPAILPVVKAYIRSGTVTETTVSVEIGFGDPANQPYPRKTYTRVDYPGLAAA
jgi:hypothetical protein